MSTFKHLKIKPLMEQYGLRTFVETGVLDGDGIQAALDFGFQYAFSCDLYERYALPAAERFQNDPRVRVSWCDSKIFMEALPLMIGPCLFWLDAHHPHFYGTVPETDENKFPVMLEIEYIKTRRDYKKDVILIDDLIVIPGSPRFHQDEVNEYYHVTSFQWEELLHCLDETHDTEYWPGMEGVLVFKPKP